jgi:hypothetical protein
MTGLNDMVDSVRMEMLGLDQMTLLERGQQASTIEQMILQARQAEIQMLRQIDALQDGINRSVDQQIEGIRTGGMSTAEARLYFQRQIQSTLGALGSAGSPEEVQQLMGDLQRYVGLLQGNLGDSLYNSTSPWGGETWADYLVGILEQGRTLSDDALQNMRDQIQDTNEALIQELRNLIDALRDFGGGTGDPNASTAYAKSAGTEGINIPVEVKVNIQGDKAMFVREVRSIVWAEMRRAAGAASAGNNPHGVN